MREDLIERLRVIAQWLDHRAHFESEPETKASHAEDADTCRESAAALEAAREDASRWRERYVAQLACYRQDLHGDMANYSIERAEKAAERIAMLDQARGKEVADDA